MENIRFFQLATFGMTFLGLIGYILWIIRKPSEWRYAIAPISWLLNVCLFYVTLFICGMSMYNTPLFIDWNAVTKLHGVFLLLGFVVIILAEPHTPLEAKLWKK